jgi:polyisoprenoid-binding protein YceI
MKQPLVLLMLLLGSGARAGAAPITFTDFDRNHSTIGFRVPILAGMSEVEGKFMSFAVTLVYDDQDLSRSSVAAVIQVASVTTGIPERDQHLLAAAFFDAAHHPEIRFTSSRIEKRGDHLVAGGILEMRGVRKQIELQVEIKGVHGDPKSGKVQIGAAATTSLDRQDYGISWRHEEPSFVGDDIRVSIHLLSKETARPTPAAGSSHGPAK